MTTDHIWEELLTLVAERVKLKKDSLAAVRKYQNTGIEGWLRVEAITALRENVKEARDIGPDLLLKVHGNKIELVLKATTDFNPHYVKKGATDFKTLCLFLGDGNDEKKIKELLDDSDINVTNYETFGVNGNQWIIGLIKPSKEYLAHH
jgi:hypothetical protein